MRIYSRKLRFYFFVFLLVGCNGPTKNDKEVTKKTKKVKNPKSKTTSVCLRNEIQKILGDGRTIVSKLSGEGSRLVLWDIFGKNVKKKIDYVFNYFEFSNSGDFLLRQVSKGRFKVLNISDSKFNYNEFIVLKRGGKPRLSFSHDEKHIYASYKIKSNIYRLNIFDIKNRDMIYGKNFRNLKFVNMMGLSNMVTLQGSSNRYAKVSTIKVHNFETGEESTMKLRQKNIKKTLLSENILIVAAEDVIYAVDTQLNKVLYKVEAKQLIDIDHNDGKLLLINSRDLFEIIDIKTGITESESRVEDNMELSSCQLNYTSHLVICKHKDNLQKIVMNNFDLRQTKEVCLESL